MANFSYKLEGSEYVLLKDNQPLKTPHGVVVTANSEELAKNLVDSLKKRKGYTSPKSILTYHYAYCNLKAQWDLEFIADDFSNCVKAEMLLDDEYLMFHQPSPIKPAVASFFEKQLAEDYHSFNLYQLAAVLVIHTAFKTWMLSQHIIADIIIPYSNDEEADFEAMKEEFLDDLEEYECEVFGCDPEDKAYIRHRKEMSDTIDAFGYYFMLQ